MSFIQSTLEGWRPTARTVNNSSQFQQNQQQINNANKQRQNQTQEYHDNNSHRRLIQQPMVKSECNNDNHWGHKILNKLDGILRIGLRNVNLLPIKKSHCKNDQYIQDIYQGQFDFFVELR
jgi:hypothetical protein